MRTRIKLLLLLALAVIGIGIYGGVRYHQRGRLVLTHVVSHGPRKSLVDHSVRTPDGGIIGSRQFLPDSKRAPKMKLAKSVVAMDARTGKIIYARNDNQPRRVASVAKLMTLFLVEQKVHRLPDGWNRVVNTSSPQLQRMGRSKSVGGFKFVPHRRYTVRDLFRAALIQSSNNSAIALGQWVAGSNENFVKLMNAQARAWHVNARFVSASGLENDDLKNYHMTITRRHHNDGNLLSAKAVAVIAQHLLTKYPSVLQDSRRQQVKVRGQTVRSLNNLLPGRAYAKRGVKIDGLKTGFTPSAGYCFVGTERGGRRHRRVITVVLHDAKEFTDTRNLMSFLYQHSRLLNR